MRAAAVMLVLAACGASAAAPALAQEPSRLEHLAGLCRTDDGAAVGRYAGRVLWTTDGRLSGMLSRDETAETAADGVREGFAPHALTIPRQEPETTADEGMLALRASAVLASPNGGSLEKTDVVCDVRATEAGRSDPGATARG